MEDAIGPDKAAPFIEAFNTSDARVMTSLLAEVATKKDLVHLEAKIEGRLSKLEVLVKVLIGLTSFAIAMFSPVAAGLFKLVGLAP